MVAELSLKVWLGVPEGCVNNTKQLVRQIQVINWEYGGHPPWADGNHFDSLVIVQFADRACEPN